MTPNAAVPCPYVAGTITLAANTVASLLELVQTQLAPNCPGTAVEFQVAADAANTSSVYAGAASNVRGPLSVTNWAYQLTPGGAARGYRAAFPGTNTPLGQLQLFSPAAAVLHIEIQA
jgi:hypothetical protein